MKCLDLIDQFESQPILWDPDGLNFTKIITKNMGGVSNHVRSNGLYSFKFQKGKSQEDNYIGTKEATKLML